MSNSLHVSMDPLLSIVHPPSFMEPSSEDFLGAYQFPSAPFAHQITRTLLHGPVALTCKPPLFSRMWLHSRNRKDGSGCSDCLLTGQPFHSGSTDPASALFANYSHLPGVWNQDVLQGEQDRQRRVWNCVLGHPPARKFEQHSFQNKFNSKWQRWGESISFLILFLHVFFFSNIWANLTYLLPTYQWFNKINQ